jgi:CheY-like chemotaxis protein
MMEVHDGVMGACEAAVMLSVDGPASCRLEPPAHAQSKPLALIIDDDAWIRTILAELLAGEGLEILQACDGRRGLALAEERCPDVILLDLILPGRSGLDVLHELKQRQPTSEIPVIVVSAYALLLVVGDQRSVHSVIQKPFDICDVLLNVRQAVVDGRQAAFVWGGQ